MGYVVYAAVGLLLIGLSTINQDTSPRHPNMTLAGSSVRAEHFAMYRGWVRTFEEQEGAGLSSGTISDSDLEVPGAYQLPAFDHHALYHSNGNVYVWTSASGALYAASLALTSSATLCHVIDTRQCVSGLARTAILSTDLTPAQIPTGSTVYVWQR